MYVNIMYVKTMYVNADCHYLSLSEAILGLSNVTVSANQAVYNNLSIIFELSHVNFTILQRAMPLKTFT